MIWTDGVDGISSRLSDSHVAHVFDDTTSWSMEIVTALGWKTVWCEEGLPTEAAAKAAVCHWIGKTMAQFGNALAAGEQREQDDGA